MPRWPEKPAEEASEQEHKPDTLTDIHNRLASIETMLKPVETEPLDQSLKITQRHGLREALAALRKLSSGQVRPPDDDSEQVLTDIINELMFWRGVNHELLQTFRSAEQRVLAQIRRLTER